jgi:hypothetical protein
MKLDVHASCDENGPQLFSAPTPCFLIPITIKCGKHMTMEAHALLDFGVSTCFIDKKIGAAIQVGPSKEEHTNANGGH